ncbi:CaiB/BaiF CoA transferase family protein [Novosphingobium pentaromativorans]|uniref:Isomerase n=1 Tax=Novosphingobium pentaromativorans US6-1 TaxID=1088721 RepID=G6ECK1_9SPHN|nr:CoA transferase [Novosphingobium pentaromativorans]AIT80033.1 formyl-CoA transferase [Novosphingobium pentaromativorans US6-1]EHJ60912.1 isomerase [Novosphingobium pentaromativorans US6-1]
MSALQGIRVLDFGRYVAGPYCATLLGDFGADVIRMERLEGGEDRGIAPVPDSGDGALFLQMSRNKRSVAYDPRAKGSAAMVERLIADADVVVVNVPPSALGKMGLDYASLKRIKPDIILANVSSFGPNGPWTDRPGFDSVGQAMCGSQYLSGSGDTPYRTPITWVDHATAVYAAFAVMVALFERQNSGRGQEIDGSLLGSALAFSSTFLIEQALTGLGRTAIGNRSFLNAPTDTFAAKDGFVVTQVVGDPIFRRWAQLMEEPHWLEDERFSSDEKRGENGEELSARMARWVAERTVAEALDQLAAARIPAGPVLSPQQALEHEQVQAMGLIHHLDHARLGRSVPLTRAPINLSETPAEIRRPAPGVGENTAQVLGEAGYSRDEIDALAASGAIRVAG